MWHVFDQSDSFQQLVMVSPPTHMVNPANELPFSMHAGLVGCLMTERDALLRGGLQP
jgi:hypothetical protein